MPYLLDVMTEADVNEVSEVEKQCFTTPWPTSAYRRELRNPAANRYLVVRWLHQNGRVPVDNHNGAHGNPLLRGLSKFLPGVFPEQQLTPKTSSIVGFGGLWLMPDEAHITTIGVSPQHRGKSLGEMLFLGMTDIALENHATWLSLEVRVSNSVAQALYRKYGLQTSGIRKHYYSDDGEDAYIMTAGPLQSAAFRSRLEDLRVQFQQRMAAIQAEDAAPAQKKA